MGCLADDRLGSDVRRSGPTEKEETAMFNPDTPGSGAPRAEEPSDELVLAAIERAALHRERDTGAVPVWAIFEHLSVARRSGPARRVRIRLDVMQAAGWIALSRQHGMQAWELTGVGSRHLRRERRAGRVPPLPESPQHSAWRNARTLAEQEIDRLRGRVLVRLDEASRLLDADQPADSDAWLEAAERLQRACRRLGSAVYCLREWAEPDDASADVDERLNPDEHRLDRAEQALRRARRAGRRNTRLWDDDEAR
jgi:hypothetical protein